MDACPDGRDRPPVGQLLQIATPAGIRFYRVAVSRQRRVILEPLTAPEVHAVFVEAARRQASGAHAVRVTVGAITDAACAQIGEAMGGQPPEAMEGRA